MWWPFGSSKKRNADSYEKDLANVAAKISARQEKQLKYNVKLRRVKGVLTLYGLLMYAIYTVICLSSGKYQNPKHISALLSAPVVIYAVRQLVQAGFNYLINANDEFIKTLQSEQEKMIEELKQKTNFYSTQALLDRFDGRVAHPPPRKKPATPAATEEKPPMTPPEGASTDFTFNSQVNSPTPEPINQLLEPQLQAVHVVPYQPKWYDRVLDMIAGEDEYSPKARYALICQKCQLHNGLAPPGQSPEHTMYTCPHCGEKNGKPQKRTEQVESEPDATDEQERKRIKQ